MARPGQRLQVALVLVRVAQQILVELEDVILNGDKLWAFLKIPVFNKHKLIRAYEVTSAEVHDSQKLVDVLSKNTSRDLWTDSAYRIQANEKELAALGLRSHIHKKGQRNKPLLEAQQRANTRKSKVRVRGVRRTQRFG